MTPVIPAKDIGKAIFQELQEFAQEQYGAEGAELLAKYLGEFELEMTMRKINALADTMMAEDDFWSSLSVHSKLYAKHRAKIINYLKEQFGV